MSKSPVAVYNFYWKISEVRYDKSVITYTTLNSQRIDKAQMTIFYLYDSLTNNIIGEEASDYFSIPSLKSPSLSYRTITSNINIYDQVIIFGFTYGAIFDEVLNKYIFALNTIDTRDFLNNPVKISKLPDDPTKPDNVYYSVAVYEN